MKVALDSTPLTVTSGGISRYTAELHAALRNAFPEHEFPLLTDQGRSGLSMLEKRWWLYGLPKQLRGMNVDVFHGTDYAVPYLPVCPAVMTVHDLSPWLDTQWHSGAARVRTRAPRLLRLGLATMVITDCEAIRCAVINRFSLPKERVVAIPLAAGVQFQPGTPAAQDPYLLYVGTLEPRKNLPMLIEAWRALPPQSRIRLVLAGRCREDCPPLPRYDGLEVLGEVAAQELPALYAAATALLYPSLYEGFGLPVLEAMACGVPVLTSRDPALLELSGGAALHVDAADGKAWTQSMLQLLAQPAALAAMRDAGLRRARQFSWHRTAIETMAVYAQAIERFRFRRN